MKRYSYLHKKSHSYTIDELNLFIDMVKGHKNPVVMRMSDLHVYQDIISLEKSNETIVYRLWFLRVLVRYRNKLQRDMIFYLSLDDMPLYINDDDFIIRLVSKWRLKIGK